MDGLGKDGDVDATIQTVTIIGSVAGLMAIGVSVMLFAMNQFGKRIDDTNRRIDDFRSETNARFDDFRGEIHARFDDFRNEIHARFDDFRGEINAQLDDFRNEINAQLDNFRGEINAQLDIKDTETIMTTM